jgi:hypothetical protein
MGVGVVRDDSGETVSVITGQKGEDTISGIYSNLQHLRNMFQAVSMQK